MIELNECTNAQIKESIGRIKNNTHSAILALALNLDFLPDLEQAVFDYDQNLVNYSPKELVGIITSGDSPHATSTLDELTDSVAGELRVQCEHFLLMVENEISDLLSI